MTATLKKKSKQALPFKRANVFLANPFDLYLETTPGNKFYSARSTLPPDEEIVAGMLSHGVEEEVLVVLHDDKAVVIDGRRRVVNAREATRRRAAEGLGPVMVRVKKVRGNELRLLEKTILTNQHRRANDPVEEAELMQHQLDLGETEKGVAKFWGLGERTVKDRLKLLELAPEVIDAVRSGKLAAQKAIRWAGKTWADQRLLLKGAPKKGVKTARRKPTKAKVAKVADCESVPDSVRYAIKWLRGEITDAEAAKQIEGLEEALA